MLGVARPPQPVLFVPQWLIMRSQFQLCPAFAIEYQPASAALGESGADGERDLAYLGNDGGGDAGDHHRHGFSGGRGAWR
jgi:hypothetical protein